ncbi:MAG TPA: glutamate--tRNA ligase [Chloroflexota bacterium]|nr:glutamate--tRNA ligase [Chloroflexota bacterium]
MPVRTRTAPSPTGDPHIGTAYRALFDSAFARHEAGQYILRIEDTDRTRYQETSEQQIFDGLRWLGIEWDEGPDKGGPYGPYRQTQRLEVYQPYAKQLVESGHAYYCWCSPERLEEVRTALQRRKLPPGYDRFCWGKTREQRAAEPGFSEPPVVRLFVPDDISLEFEDLIRGRISAPKPNDPILLRSNGYPTYHLGVVVDDHLMEISHVTRGEEWISSTPIHLQLYEAFGWQAPRFAHFPLLRNPDGSKISKRKNPAGRLLWFVEEGFLPEALRNYLGLMGWSMPDEREIFSYQEMVEHFTWSRFSTGGPVFDVRKLEWMNNQYIQRLSDAELVERITPFLPGPGQRDALLIMAPVLKERLHRLKEACEQLEFLFVGEVDLDRALLEKQGSTETPALEALRAAESVVRSISPYEVAAISDTFDADLEARGWKPRHYYMPIRVAISGKDRTPPLFHMLAALGRERALQRLEDAVHLLTS